MKLLRDTYVTPDGIVREDNFQMNFDTDLDEDEEQKEPDEPTPLAVGGRRYPVWYYAGKLKQLASENKVRIVSHFLFFSHLPSIWLGSRNTRLLL